MASDDLIIFATEIARRQYVRQKALQDGFVDASRCLTMSGLRALLESAARDAGLVSGRVLTPAGFAIVARRTAAKASADFGGSGPLGTLRPSALADTLANLVETLSPFAADAAHVHELMLAAPEGTKLSQLGLLYKAYRDQCTALNRLDLRDLNTASHELLQGPLSRWPRALAECKGRIVFRAVRWLNPFEERVVVLLKTRLGPERVRVHSVLPPAHAEKMEDRLRARVRTEVMMGAEEAWTSWAENLTDAMEVEDTNLAVGSRECVSFSRSVGLYGEIEDVARYIRWELEESRCPPERIALIVRNLGDYGDSVRHVFSRFGIPCHLRRGDPLHSVPVVKSFLSLLSLPLTLQRDTLCALLQSAAINWPGLPESAERTELAHDIPAAGVRPRLGAANIRHRLHAYHAAERHDLAPAVAQARVEAVVRIVNELRALAQPAPPREHAKNALRILARFRAEPASPGRRALDTVGALIGQIADAAGDDAEPQPLREFTDLLESCSETLTTGAAAADESGVWVMNPFDACGLQFDVVIVAGLNEGVFPSIPRQDSLFSDEERESIRAALKKKGVTLPFWALPPSTVRMLQESILFLACIGAARRRLVLSCQASDTDGRELVPSDFFRSLWHLVGWPSAQEIEPGPYDAWRMKQTGPSSFLAGHFRKQQTVRPYQRTPMPGTSYLATPPLSLCCAADEARQRVARAAEEPLPPEELRVLKDHDPAGDRAPHATARAAQIGLGIERAREAFFNSGPSARAPVEPYCGKLRTPAMRDLVARWAARHDEFSPTALEVLAKCRYRFLLSRMCYLEALRTQEDTPDVMDRGRIVHRILELTYRAMRGDTAPLAEIAPEAVREFAALCAPSAWAICAADGTWRLSDKDPRKGADRALPLARFRAADRDHLSAFGHAVADAVFAYAEQAGDAVRLGDPGVWSTEKPKIRQIIANYLALDAETAEEERRYPALFELRFGRQPDRTPPDMPALALGGEKGIRVHGQIDRLDVLFDEDGALASILVIDYKGVSRALGSGDLYAEEILENLDCQLPVYGFVAQQFLFGRHDEPDLNARTQVVYHVQARAPSDMKKQFAKGRVGLDHGTESGVVLTAGFMERLLANTGRLADADFSVDPLDCTHCDFQHVCRVDVNALEGIAGSDDA